MGLCELAWIGRRTTFPGSLCVFTLHLSFENIPRVPERAQDKNENAMIMSPHGPGCLQHGFAEVLKILFCQISAIHNFSVSRRSRESQLLLSQNWCENETIPAVFVCRYCPHRPVPQDI